MNGSFAYTARDVGGSFVCGTLLARSREEAFDLLRARALHVTAVDASDSARGFIMRAATLRRRDTRARIGVFRSLAALIGAGLPLRAAFGVVADSCKDASMREAMLGVGAEVESGVALSAAMERRVDVFSRTTCAMVRAGEAGGTLDHALARVARLCEASDAQHRRIASAMAYPLMVLVGALTLIAFVVSSVVPTVSTMLNGLGAGLPPITRALIAVGGALRQPSFLVTVSSCAIAIGLLFARVRRQPLFLRWFERATSVLPAVGRLRRVSQIGQCARTLSALLQAGVSLESALGIARTVAASPSIQDAFDCVASVVRLGQPISDGFAAARVFDGVFLALVRAGEEAGTLAEMLERLAGYADVELETTLTTLSAVLEPALMLVLGVIVAGIVGAILIPLYSAIGSIQ